MPKMKTNRMARKKFRTGGRKGGKARLRKAQANTSHNTGKRSAKRIRQLRKRTGVDSTSDRQVRIMLPYA